jgi:hypothetical protein
MGIIDEQFCLNPNEKYLYYLIRDTRNEPTRLNVTQVDQLRRAVKCPELHGR